MTTDRTMLVIPRQVLGPFMPLLMYPAYAARVRGATVRQLSWEPPVDEFDAGRLKRGPWVLDQVRPAIEELLNQGHRPLLVGSSLGTRAAPLAVEYDLPAIWLTPPLNVDDWVANALAEASAPFLLIGGAKDPMWDGDRARSVAQELLELPEANHSLLVPGPLENSTAVLGQVITRIEEFMDTHVWPVDPAA